MSEPMAMAANCEHHYESRLLGGHPLIVRACTFCRKPDWADLMEQAVELYRWGWEEGRAGKAAREALSAYDKPREAAGGELAGRDGDRNAQPTPGPSLRERLVAGLDDLPVACWTPGNIASRVLRILEPELDELRDTQTALARVHHLADLIAAGAPWTANHGNLARRIRDAATVDDGQTATQATETPEMP